MRIRRVDSAQTNEKVLRSAGGVPRTEIKM
jgi:hypothetical protein